MEETIICDACLTEWDIIYLEKDGEIFCQECFNELEKSGIVDKLYCFGKNSKKIALEEFSENIENKTIIKVL